MNNIMMFPAELTSLSPSVEWLTQQIASLLVADEWRFAFDLAACETTTNVIRYTLREDREGHFGMGFGVADRRATLRFTDTGETFPAERPALARGDGHLNVNPLAGSGRGLRLTLRVVDFFDVGMNTRKSITTLVEVLPDPPVNYSTDRNGS